MPKSATFCAKGPTGNKAAVESIRPIFLIGFMACGKSTLLKALADRVGGRVFVDLDSEIERMAGMPVAEIFRSRGQEYFRGLESSLLARFAATGAVVACGGGTPCREGAMELMKAAGTVVWLRADTETTVRRLMLAPGQRPLVDDVLADSEALRARVEAMMADRMPHYAKADAVFDSSRLETAEEIARTADKFINEYI